MSKKSDLLTENYLKVANHFKLGSLSTERPHPKTKNLSQIANHDLPKAISLLKEVDLDALHFLYSFLPHLEKLHQDILKALEAGDRIFLCGCGATGRLALSLEALWRTQYKIHPLSEKVISFMAGGDTALIKSIESFEDHPEYGARQLLELGFEKNDLLIAITEGGETPYVIGATLEAQKISNRLPYFLYCNPNTELTAVSKRSLEIISHPGIHCLSLEVGPMALAGSTRMQATTVLQLAIGYPLLSSSLPFSQLKDQLKSLIHHYQNFELALISDFIIEEASIYQKNEKILYSVSSSLAINLLTDITERSPTFSLHGFENQYIDEGPASPSYLHILEAEDNTRAWELLLKRPPRPLNWDGPKGSTSSFRLEGFELSSRIRKTRPFDTLFFFKLMKNNIVLKLNSLTLEIETSQLTELNRQVFLKMLINTHSTLVMGRNQRYLSNIMTYVRPSNHKLIDRTIRYAQVLLCEQGLDISYDEVARTCFREKEVSNEAQSVVLGIVNHYIKYQKTLK